MILFLVYHRIIDSNEIDKQHFHSVNCDLFTAQLECLKESKLSFVNPRTLNQEWPAQQHGIVLSFDDGTSDHLRIVIPILRKFNIKALFFIPTSKLDKDNHLTSHQVRFIWHEGHIIGSHGHSHKRLDLLSHGSIRKELGISRKILYNILKENPIYFAPPGGLYNWKVKQAARHFGYQYFRTMHWGFNRSFNSERIEVVPVTNILNCQFLEQMLQGKAEQALKIIYFLKSQLRSTITEQNYYRFQKKIFSWLKLQ